MGEKKKLCRTVLIKGHGDLVRKIRGSLEEAAKLLIGVIHRMLRERLEHAK